MCVCVCTCVYVNSKANIIIILLISTYINSCGYIYTCIYVCIFSSMCTYMYVYHIDAFVWFYPFYYHTFVSIWLYIWIHAYTIYVYICPPPNQLCYHHNGCNNMNRYIDKHHLYMHTEVDKTPNANIQAYEWLTYNFKQTNLAYSV